jgi:anti-anti-sigma factor
MDAIGTSFFALPDRHPVLGGSDPEVVVWLRGQHDASTESALCMTLARAIALGGPGLVLDLAEVRVMSTSTLAAIARAREYLRRRSASLTVRSPSPPVRRLIDACGLNELLGPAPRQADIGEGERSVLGPSQPVPVPKRAAPRTSAKAWV